MARHRAPSEVLADVLEGEAGREAVLEEAAVVAGAAGTFDSMPDQRKYLMYVLVNFGGSV